MFLGHAYVAATGSGAARAHDNSATDALRKRLRQPPPRRAEPLRSAPEPAPRIALALEPPGHRLNRPPVRSRRAVFEFLPMKRGRDRSVPTCPYRVLRDRGVGVGVAHD